jgi:hypothetical protein
MCTNLVHTAGSAAGTQFTSLTRCVTCIAPQRSTKKRVTHERETSDYLSADMNDAVEEKVRFIL